MSELREFNVTFKVVETEPDVFKVYQTALETGTPLNPSDIEIGEVTRASDSWIASDDTVYFRKFVHAIRVVIANRLRRGRANVVDYDIVEGDG